MLLLPLNFAKAAGWLFFIQVRHFVTQLLQIFLVSWGRLQKSKMEKAKVLSNSADHTIHFAFARFTLAGRGAACACCLGCALGLLLFLFFFLPLPGVWIQRLVCLVWFEGWHGHKQWWSVAEAAAASSIVLQLACLFFSGEADFSKTAKRILSSLNRNMAAGERLKKQVLCSKG